MRRITIIGLGLIGSSMGMAIRNKYGDEVEIVGYDAVQQPHNEARKIGAVDRSEWNLDKAVDDADMVIIATPASAMYDIMETIAPFLKDGAVVTDTAATKRAVLDWAEALLPDRVGFVGGHPLAGAGFRGQRDATPTLFDDKRYAIVASPSAPERAVAELNRLVEDLGARPFFLDVDEHDSYSAAVNGLPIVVATALMGAVASSPAWREIYRFTGHDFDVTTGPCSQDPPLSHSTAVTNPEMMIHWINQMIGQLTTIRDGIADEDTRWEPTSELTETFVKAWEARAKIDVGIEPGAPTGDNPLPTAGESAMTMFFGRAAARFSGKPKKKDPTQYDRRRFG